MNDELSNIFFDDDFCSEQINDSKYGIFECIFDDGFKSCNHKDEVRYIFIILFSLPKKYSIFFIKQKIH